MEKLRAKWIKELAKAERRISNADFNDTKPLGLAEAYEDVLRDTEWFNEEFSKLLAEVTSELNAQNSKHQKAINQGYQVKAEIYDEKVQSLYWMKQKLERLNQGKEVRT